MNLKQVAIYNLSPKAKHSSIVSHTHARRHGHHHMHKKHAEAHQHQEEKGGDIWVTATINGQIQSWINTWHGPTPAAAPLAENPAAAPLVAPTPTSAPAVSEAPVAAFAASKPASSSKASTPSTKGSGSDYTRVGYYNADKAIADGIVFLGNYGGQGSGKFDK